MPSVPTEVDPVLLGVLLSPLSRVAAFVWGTLWGSFANVVIHRIALKVEDPDAEISIARPRSRCPHCETPIAGYDNIPVVSYLILRGRCRHCGEPISMRYLVVELLAGVLSFALYMRFVYVPLVEGAGPGLVPWLLWFAYGLALLVITYVDLDVWVIPDAIVLPMAVVGVGMAAVAPDQLGVGIVEALVAAVAGWGSFVGIRTLYLRLRGIEALGLGDAKLLLMVGAFTGYRGLLWCVAAGAVQGLLVSVPMLLLGRKIANTELTEVHGDDPELGEEEPAEGISGNRVPFGPFLALAAMEYALLRTYIDDLLGWLVGG